MKIAELKELVDISFYKDPNMEVLVYGVNAVLHPVKMAG